MSIFVESEQIGYMHTRIGQAKLDGKTMNCKSNEMHVRIKKDALKYGIDCKWETYADDQFMPVLVTFRTSIKDGGKDHWSNGEWRCTSNSIKSKVSDSDSGSNDKTITYPAPRSEDLIESCKYEFGIRKLRIGDKITKCHFRMYDLVYSNPGLYFKFDDKPTTMQVLRSETLELNGKTHQALVMVENLSYGEVTRWFLENGEELKSENPTLIRFMTSSREEAVKILNGDGPELLSIGRFGADRAIPDADGVVEMKAKLSGIQDQALIKSDGRQTASFDSRKKTVEYHVVARGFEASKSLSLPIKQSEYAKWLESRPGIEVGDPAIQEQAKEIVGSETNACKAAGKIRAWVEANMTPTLTYAQAKSALEVLKTKTGVCTHYSLLYVALARAAGIPARLVSGLSYGEFFKEKCFLTHMWAEVYVGEWIPVDPMKHYDWVNATYIKFKDGNLEDVGPFTLWKGRFEIVDLKDRSTVPEDLGPGHFIRPQGEFAIKYPSGELLEYPSNKQLDEFTPPEGSIALIGSDGITTYFRPGTELDPSDASPDDYYPGLISIKWQDGRVYAAPEGSCLKIVASQRKDSK